MLSRPGHSQLGAGSVRSTFMVHRLQNGRHRLRDRLRVASCRGCWNKGKLAATRRRGLGLGVLDELDSRAQRWLCHQLVRTSQSPSLHMQPTEACQPNPNRPANPEFLPRSAMPGCDHGWYIAEQAQLAGYMLRQLGCSADWLWFAG